MVYSAEQVLVDRIPEDLVVGNNSKATRRARRSNMAPAQAGQEQADQDTYKVLTPTLDTERRLWQAGKLRVAGVDEAGRGPLAGPVVAAACLIASDCQMIEGVRDSKLLSRRQRESLLEAILAQALAVGIGAASVAEIERLNILKASYLAMRRALARIGTYDHALIDGNEIKRFDLGPHTAIVDGDALCYSIACASIVAKVTRDRLMCRLAPRYPAYGWEHNVGYDTPGHRAALADAGLTPFHRRTYAPVRELVDGLSRLDGELG